MYCEMQGTMQNVQNESYQKEMTNNLTSEASNEKEKCDILKTFKG